MPISHESFGQLVRVLLGVKVGAEPAAVEDRTATIAVPSSFGGKMLAVSRRHYVKFSTFERLVGLGAWLFPVKRRAFSIFFEVYRLLRRKRRAGTKKHVMIRLSKKVRAEFYAAGVLAPALEHCLDFKPA